MKRDKTQDPARRGFDWALIRRFLAVLDAGSLSRAARALSSHQGTLSRQIAELETQLGGPLFERTGRGLAPTALARTISDAARQMEVGASTLENALAESRAKKAGTIRITASRAISTWLLPPVLTRLTDKLPEVSVVLSSSDDVANLLRREADIAVRMVRPVQASIVARKLADIPLVAAAHRDFLARHGVPRKAEDLGSYRLIGFDRQTGIMDGLAMRGIRLSPDNFTLRTDDHVAYARLVQAGAGIGFVTAYHLQHLSGLVRVLPELKPATLSCWLAVHREIRGEPLIRKVYDFLAREIVQELK